MFPLVGALWAVRFTGGGYSQGEAVDLFEVFGGEADEAVEEAVFGAFPCDGFLGHFGKAGVVDADLCESGREAELFLEVFPQAFDAFLRDLDGVLAFGGDAHDAYGEAGDAGGGGFVQDVGEEGGGEDGEAEAVGDVVVGGEFVLDAVAGPGDGMAAVDEVVDGPGGGPEEVRAGVFIGGVGHGDGGVFHDGAHHGFHVGFGGGEGLFFLEVDFHDVGEDVGGAAGGLIGGDGVGVFGAEEGDGGAEGLGGPAVFFFGLGVGDDGAGIHFGAGRGDGGDGDEGEGGVDGGAASDEVPGVGVVGGAACDDFGGVEDGASAEGEDEVQAFFAYEADAFADEADLGIWLDAGEAVAVDIGLADFCEDFVEEAALFGGAAAGDEEDAAAEAADLFGKVGEHAVSEVDFGGVMVDEIVGHGDAFLVMGD